MYLWSYRKHVNNIQNLAFWKIENNFTITNKEKREIHKRNDNHKKGNNTKNLVLDSFRNLSKALLWYYYIETTLGHY